MSQTTEYYVDKAPESGNQAEGWLLGDQILKRRDEKHGLN